MTQYALNLVMDHGTPFIKDQTVHRVREIEGPHITATCGTTFYAEVRERNVDPDELPDRYRCGRCF